MDQKVVDYKQAANVRAKGFGDTMADKLQSGEGIGASFKKTISEKTKAKVTGIKESFNILNVAKTMTGGSRLAPTVLGKMLGRSSDEIKHFNGDGVTEDVGSSEKGSAEKVLGQIYDLMIQQREEELKRRGIERNLREEIDAETTKRDKQIIESVTEKEKGKPAKPSKPKKPSTLKKAVIKTAGFAASAGLVLAAATRPPAPPKEEEVKPEEKPKQVPTTPPTIPPTEAPTAGTPSAKPATKLPPMKAPASPGFQVGKKEVLTAMDKEGIKNPDARAQILAQTAHESGSFKYTQELGNAQYFQRYEGRKDLGNVNPGDGLKYIGRGFLQTTGRVNYQQFADAFHVDVINNPEKLAEPSYAAESALFWFKKNAKKVERMSNGDWTDTKGVTRAVNGGYNGLDDRMRYYEMFKNDPEVVGKAVAEKNSPSATPQNPTPPGATVASSSQTNQDLKENLKTEKSAVVAKTKNTTNINQSQTAATPDKVDDRSAYLRKTQAA
jgi:putative chitinase